MTFSEKLKKLRKEKKVTQEQLAKIIGVERSSIGKYETGTQPSTDIMKRIADYFGVTVDYLLGREETKKAPVSPAVTTEDEELMEYLEELRSRPEMRMLFSLSKNATKEDVEDAVRIIEALRKGRRD